MESVSGHFNLHNFKRYRRLAVVLCSLAVVACSSDQGPSADSEQAAAAAQQLLAKGAGADGKALYQACVACHGDEAQGNQSLGAPSLRNQQSWYLTRQLQAYRSCAAAILKTAMANKCRQSPRPYPTARRSTRS